MNAVRMSSSILVFFYRPLLCTHLSQYKNAQFKLKIKLIFKLLLIIIKMSPFMDETTTDYGAVRLASDVAETKQCALNVRVATDHMFPTGKTFRKRGSIRHSIKLFLTF